MYGDFEDLETGEKFEGGRKTGDDGDGSEEEDEEDGASAGEGSDEEDEEERRRREKIAKKEAFMTDGDGKGKKKGGFGRGADGVDEEEPASYFDLVKNEMQDQMARTRRELDAMPEATSEALEGYRPGRISGWCSAGCRTSGWITSIRPDRCSSAACSRPKTRWDTSSCG